MQFRRILVLMQLVCVSVPLAVAQELGTPAQAAAAPAIKVETRVVLVDTVVTGKKGNYIRDLKAKDFRVWEDNKEQEITSFSFEADPAAPSRSQPRYLILFFDNSTMDWAQQAQARLAAAKFIDSNAGPNRLMAIVDYANGLRIAQNFTDDSARLKKVVASVNLAGTPGPSFAGAPALGRAESDYRVRDVLLALRSLVRNLESVPGRKSLVMLTAGFPLTQDRTSELTALIDACNKANVAIYPIDARGLVAPIAFMDSYPRVLPAESTRAVFQLASFVTPAAFFQRGGAPGGGGAGAGGRGAGGGTPGGGAGAGAGGRSAGPSAPSGGGRAPGGATGVGTPGGNAGGARGGGNFGGNTGNRTAGSVSPFGTNPWNPRNNLPPFPESASTNQQALFMLASGTGGFVIANTNDLLGGLEKIGKEQNEYYLIGYSPDESTEGSCHSLRVKVDRGGTQVRARSGYCNVKARDLLAGNPVEKELEQIATAPAPGNIKASMLAPFFYTAPNMVRANVAMEIPTSAFEFEKRKGKLHSAVNVLGVVSRQDGGVAARFSDTLKVDFENKKEVQAFQEKPTAHYQKDFDVAPGRYSLKVVFSSSAENFGKLEMPLVIEAYDGTQFTISGLALSRQFRKVSDNDLSLDSALLEDRSPLVANGLEFFPSGTSRFKKADVLVVYAEVYEPALLNPEQDPDPLKRVAAVVQLRVLDPKTGQAKLDSGMMRATDVMKPGNPVIPVALRVPVEQLAPGSYQLEVKAADTAGHAFKRIAEFEIQ